MADVLSKGTMFPELLVTEMFNLVKGHSSLAKLSAQKPIPFNGTKLFTFTLDKEVDIVAENGAKGKGGATATPISIIPVKVEYGARVSDEFKYASEEVKLDYLRTFAEGFAKKVARGIDLMAFHGVNPRTGVAALTIGNNCFEKAVTNKVVYAAETADVNLEDAIALVRASEGDLTGLALSPDFATAMAKIKVNGVTQYPEFRFGANPGQFAGMISDVNKTLSDAKSKKKAIVGDFANAFKWGFAKEIPLEVIEYGNPDNDLTLGDLKGHNQIYLRGEAYIGWGILDKNSFAKIEANG